MSRTREGEGSESAMAASFAAANPFEESDIADQPHAYPYDLEDLGVGSEDDFGNDDSESSLFGPVTKYTEYAAVAGDNPELEIDEEEEEEELNPAHPTKKKKKYRRGGWWWKGNKEVRKMFLRRYTVIILLLVTFLLSVFAIFWGTLYGRMDRLTNMKVLVSVEDDRDGFVTDALLKAIKKDSVKMKLGWDVQDKYMDEKTIKSLVHHQKYWAAVYVNGSDVSSRLVSAFENNKPLNVDSLVSGFYETGRDPNGVKAYVLPGLAILAHAYSEILRLEKFPAITKSLTSKQFTALQGSKILSDTPELTLTDGIRMTNPVMMAPLQVGFVFIVILTGFQVLWFMKLNAAIAQRLRSKAYILYRMVVAQLTFLLLSLAYTCLNRAFQIHFTKSSFGEMWMLCYLIMSAVGGANENACTVCASILAPLVGFWLLFFVIINIAGTFSPLELCPEFYKFSYAMPVKNGYELMKIVFFDTYQGGVGQYIGVLLGWVIANNLLLPFCMVFFAHRMQKMRDHQDKVARERLAQKAALGARTTPITMKDHDDQGDDEPADLRTTL